MSYTGSWEPLVIFLAHCNISPTPWKDIKLHLVHIPDSEPTSLCSSLILCRKAKYQFYSLWFDLTGACILDLPHSRRSHLTIRLRMLLFGKWMFKLSILYGSVNNSTSLHPYQYGILGLWIASVHMNSPHPNWWSSTNFRFFVPIWNSKWRLRQDLI